MPKGIEGRVTKMVSIVLDYGVSDSDINAKVKNFEKLSNEPLQIYKIDDLLKRENTCMPDDIKRCIFITLLPSGIMQYHEDFIAANKHIMSWIISVCNVEHEPYRIQYKKQIEGLFYNIKTSYEIIFDISSSLRATMTACEKPIKEKLFFCIISGNKMISKAAESIFQMYLPTWEVKSASVNEVQYADAVLIIGKDENDYNIPAPAKKMGWRFVWINEINATKEKKEDLLEKIDTMLSKCNWEFADFHNSVFLGDLQFEKLYYQFKNGETSDIMLKNDDSFVMWDEFGLPVLLKDYNNKNIKSFFEKNCCICKIAEMLK